MYRQRLSMLLPLFALTAGAVPPPDLRDRVSVPVYYTDQAVVISTDEGVALIRFTAAIPDGRKFKYRFVANGAGAKEEQGEGKVFEKYERKRKQPPEEGFEVKDAGGQLKLVAGKVALEWSWGSDDRGWLYFVPEEERVQFVDAKEFEKLELSRFAK